MMANNENYSDNQSIRLSNVNNASCNIKGDAIVEITPQISELSVHRHKFVATSWSSFKSHFIYQFNVEIELLRNFRNWIYIVLGFVIIYLHVAAHNLAYYLATPGPALHDLGHELLPATTSDSPLFAMNSYLLIFMFSFVLFTGVSVLFVRYDPAVRFTAVGYLNRIFKVINITQLMRITTFLVTQVPAPNPNCAQPFFDPPKSFSDIFARSAGSGDRGCGDLIFSSHVMFGLVILFMHYRYMGLNRNERLEPKGNNMQVDNTADSTFSSKRTDKKKTRGVVVFISRRVYLLRMLVVLFLALCVAMDVVFIIASRKHYSVDVVVSVYITSMVWYIVDRNCKDPKVPTLAPLISK